MLNRETDAVDFESHQIKNIFKTNKQYFVLQYEHTIETTFRPNESIFKTLFLTILRREKCFPQRVMPRTFGSFVERGRLSTARFVLQHFSPSVAKAVASPPISLGGRSLRHSPARRQMSSRVQSWSANLGKCTVLLHRNDLLSLSFRPMRQMGHFLYWYHIKYSHYWTQHENYRLLRIDF